MNGISDTAIVLDRHVAHVHHGRGPNRQQGLNDVLAIVLVAVVALAAVPLGSNRPFFWALWAAGLGLLATVYLLALLRRRETLRFALSRLALPLVLLVAVLGMLAVQLVPLAPEPGVAFTTAAGETVRSPTLSLAPGSTWLMLLQLLSYGLFFLLMLQVSVNRRRARAMGLALLAIITAHAVYGLVALVLLGDSLLFFDKWAYPGFATGTFVNRNSYATFLAFGLVLGVVYSLREALNEVHRHKGRLRLGHAPIHLAATGLILAALLATGSRMGLFAGLAGAGCAAVMAIGKQLSERRRRRWLLLAIVPALAALAVLVLHGAGTLERLGSVETDANVRADLYAQALGMIATRPWLGFGGGSFELAYPLFHQLPVSPDLVWDKAHSTYLSLWVELGVVAGSLPLLIIALLAFDALRLYFRRSGDWAAPAAAFSVVVVAALHSLVDFSLEIEANALLFLAILAIGIGRTRDRGGEPDHKGVVRR